MRNIVLLLYYLQLNVLEVMMKYIWSIFLLANELYAMAHPSVVYRLFVVCNVRMRPTQAVQIFGNISKALGTVAIQWRPLKIPRRSSQGTPPSGELNTRG